MKPLLYMVLLFLVTSEIQAHPGCMFPEQVRRWRAAPQEFVSVRPDAAFHRDSVDWPLRIHWQEGVTDEYAAEILAYAETTWAKLFRDMGFATPHPDGELGGDERFDVYIVTDLDPLIGGYASFSGFYEPTDRADAFGYLVINNEIDIRIRRFVVAHEMFHGSQMAYDWWEDMSFMEGSATWIVDHVFDDEDIYWRYYEFFNKQPFLAADFISLANPYQYGSGMFVQFLDEHYGAGDGAWIKDVWEASIQDGFDNEPDFFDVIDQKTAATGGLDQAWRTFGEWRVMTGSRDDGEHFSEGGLWDAVRMDPYFEAELHAGITELRGTTLEPLGPYSHAMISWKRDPEKENWFEIKLGQDVERRIAVDLLWLGPSSLARQPLGVLTGAGETQLRGLAPAGAVEAVIIFSNLTDGRYDADTSPWDRHPLRFSLQMQAADIVRP